MTGPGPDASQAAAAVQRVAAGSPTRGFLFADLREYTRYVEEHGAADAASLLVRYRTLVRGAVAAHDGAEIKTEGDSFYVVFPAVSQAVLCGLDIVDAADSGSSDADARPIPVGIGIHAGETVDTPDGFVGQPVNIAARICALARSGEVLVSDTVRALTQTVLPVAFDPRGRRTLKGVNEPVAVYAVARSAAAWAPQKRRATRRRRLALGGIVAAVLVVGGLTAWILSRPAPGLPPGPWTIGLDATFSGGSAAFGIPIRNAVEMAVDDANAAGGIGGSQLVLDARDDAGGKNGHDPVKGAANTTTFIADPKSVAMIGPDASNVAAAMIPLTNAAGFFECSPSNSNPRLTKPREGALDLRSAFPDRINYVRLAPADDIQGPALASYVYNDLHATSTLVIDDAGDGRDIADRFTEAYLKFGGTTVRRALNPGSDPSDVLSALDSAGGPMAVFFGGFGDSGAVPLRQAMVAKGHGAIPFVSWDGISGGADDPTSFIANAGPAATGSYYSHAAIAIPKADFVTRYRARFHVEPDEYAPAAYACAQVIFEALTGVAKTGPNAAELREAVRAYAVDITHRYETVIGSVGFDANGDSLQQFVTFYRVDPSAAGGKGDWVIDKQQDYGPAP